MIFKTFEINKINLSKYNLYLFYGENEGYKNEIIKKKFEKLYTNQIYKYEEKKSTEFNLNFNSRVAKTVASKDKKGNPIKFSIKIMINLEVFESEILKGKKNFEEKFEYTNRSNKFDLKQYEKNIKDNLISELSNEIIKYLIYLK